MIDLTKIQTLIAAGELDKAFDVLLQNPGLKESAYFNSLVLLKSRMSRLSKMQFMMNNQQGDLERNQITYALLELIGTIANNPQFSTGPSNPRSDRANTNPAVVDRITKILFLQAVPLDMTRLFVEKEIDRIETGLRSSRHREKFSFIKKGAVSAQTLSQSVLNERPHIVHFSGHGTEAGIFLLGPGDQGVLVNGVALSNTFKLFCKEIACVFLNSCYSEEQAQLINKYIPYVIGMRIPVRDHTAIEFSAAFYRALGAGEGFEFAFEFAKNSLDLQSLPDSDVPVLLFNDRTECK